MDPSKGLGRSNTIQSAKAIESAGNTKKELIQRLIRILMLQFTTYIEIVKSGQFGAQNMFLKTLTSTQS